MIQHTHRGLSMLTNYDLHLLGEGRHWQSYQKLGAHVSTEGGIAGVHFAVWAPNATAVSVVGDFNDWDGRQHQLRRLPSAGIWELFLPGLSAGTIYKYRVDAAGGTSERADPYGFGAEVPPGMPPASSTSTPTRGVTMLGWPGGPPTMRSLHRSTPMRSIWGVGGDRVTIRSVGSPTPTWSGN